MTLPSFSVKGKVTIVTGASRGISNALAKGFAEAGSPIALVARPSNPEVVPERSPSCLG